MLKAAVLSLALALAMATSTAQASTKTPRIDTIESYIASTHHRQMVMGVGLTRTSGSYLRSQSIPYRNWVVVHWKKINWQVLQRFLAVPNQSAWQCIHGGEGSWQDDYSPFWGGMQMDMDFQSSYGAYLLALKGTANHWTPTEQMWVAEHARASGRGFYPWPKTARSCGLI